MTKLEARQILAEKVMGWERERAVSINGSAAWLSPDGKYYELPDPFTSAADCDALLDKLASDGWEFSLWYRPSPKIYSFSLAKQREEFIVEHADKRTAVCLCALRTLGIQEDCE